MSQLELSNPVFAVDIAGKLIYVNRAAEAMAGRAHHELVGHPLADPFDRPAEATQCLAGLIWRAMAENRRVGPSSIWILDHRYSDQVQMELHAEPFHDRDGRVAGAVIVCREAATAIIPATLEYRHA